MAQTNNSYCQNFTETFNKLKDSIHSADLNNLLVKFIANPNKSTLAETLLDIGNQKQGLIKEFQTRTRAIIETWKEKQNTLHSSVNDFQYDFEDNSQRIIVKGNLQCNSLTFFPSLIRKISGNFSGYDPRVKSLDYLEEIEGNFKTPWNSQIYSMKRLRKVGGSMTIGERLYDKLPIANLDSLEYVGDTLFVNGRITSLPKLRYAKALELDFSPIQYLDSLEQISDGLFLGETPFKSAKNLIKVGYLLIKTPIENLDAAFPALREIGVSNYGYSALCPTRTAVNRFKAFVKKRNIVCKGNIILKQGKS